MIYFCCDQRRRNDLAGSAFNGIDYLEVLDHEIEQSDPANRQKKLVVHFINDLAAGALDKPNILIEGGERIPGIIAINVAVDVQDAKLLNIELESVRRFLHLYFAPGAKPTEPGAAGDHRSDVRRRGFFVQGRLPERFRLPAALRLSGRAARRARDQLSGQGLRVAFAA